MSKDSGWTASCAVAIEYGPPLAADSTLGDAMEACKAHFIQSNAVKASYKLESRDPDSNKILIAEVVLSEAKTLWERKGNFDELLKDLKGEGGKP